MSAKPWTPEQVKMYPTWAASIINSAAALLDTYVDGALPTPHLTMLRDAFGRPAQPVENDTQKLQAVMVKHGLPAVPDMAAYMDAILFERKALQGVLATHSVTVPDVAGFIDVVLTVRGETIAMLRHAGFANSDIKSAVELLLSKGDTLNKLHAMVQGAGFQKTTRITDAIASLIAGQGADQWRIAGQGNDQWRIGYKEGFKDGQSNT